jgi:hypothetical protein
MKVAVIGAGFSGMLAAYLLEKEGINVTVYEKQEYLGGHCRTLTTINKNTELGTVAFFSKAIKELLIELQIDYTERFVYRHFLDENYNNVEHILGDEVAMLMNELGRLKVILEKYKDTLETTNYGNIHPDLLVPLSHFLKIYNLNTVYHVIVPYLSSFGFGNIEYVQAYYAFKVFNINTIYTFIQGKKLLFIKRGTTELIQKLSEKISDIRLSLEVTSVNVKDNKVTVDTLYSSEAFDKVLITTKLPTNVVKDELYNELMQKIITNPFITCAFEVSNKKLATTYYKSNLGKKGKIQFFYTSRQNHKTTLVAYAYGIASKKIISDITMDLSHTGIDIKHLITVKQWYIFPHLKNEDLSETFYEDIYRMQKRSNIWLIGSLISKPELGNLYLSIRKTIKELID